MTESIGHNEVIIVETKGEGETIALAARLAKLLRRGDVVALAGDLGAGKTRFVRGLASGLGIDPQCVTSPTFVLMHEYVSGDNASAEGSMVLVHIDAYRLSGVEDLESIGWDELVAGGDVIIAVEWAERIAEALPDDRVDISIEHIGAEERRVEIFPRGKLRGIREWSSLMKPIIGKESAGRGETAAKTSCRICGEATFDDSEFFPFCSSRCRLVDLGKWLDGKYLTSREMTAGDEEV